MFPFAASRDDFTNKPHAERKLSQHLYNQEHPMAKARSKSNTLGDKTQSLQTFTLPDLALYTQEKSYATNASKDFHLFYVGRDDVHDVLKHVLSRVSVSLYINMFGYDDEETQRHPDGQGGRPAGHHDDYPG